MNTELIRRVIHPQVRVISEAEGIVEYVASDETLDCYDEIIVAGGWRFDRFEKNAPFVDSHDTSTIKNQVGSVIDYKVVNRQLIERVKWAKDIAENTLAVLGFKMTVAGFLKAVSVGFFSLREASRFSSPDAFVQAVKDLGLPPETAAQVRRIFLEQDQIELSACVIGANPNAVARAYKGGVLTEEEIDKFTDISAKVAKSKTVRPADNPADVERAQRRAKLALLAEIQTYLN